MCVPNRRLSGLFHDQRGATAVEYGLIAALIVLAAVGGFAVLGGGMGTLWGNVHNSM